ncbi:hypothetical protein EIP91_008249 [Steccherinum ochraceum]|uniref:Aldehyde dehydrogenase n=1 Tax=Steccherinum ochraceum TaxID=92696 RepID=A0A4R0RD81_9APHY|nr:hypothetical protein EIP91_008249 [Steccherinum ochraceum]
MQPHLLPLLSDLFGGGHLRDELRRGFASGKTKPIAYRKEQLARLAYMVQENRDAFHEAMTSDLGRGTLENDFMDFQPALGEITDAYNNVEKWSKPQKPAFNINWFAMNPEIRKEPKGTVLIISPFNFPMVLILGPLAGALAAGCTALIKPSEQAPATAAVYARLVPQYLDPDACRVVLGAVPETTKLLELQWDQILYTGSARVAKIVLAAAAKHLTPVVTELGGKNPVIVDPKMDLTLAARRIAWGKFSNSGQICVSPDYVIVTEEIKEKFIKELLAVYATFYPDGPRHSDSFSRMATKNHAARMQRLLAETKGKIVIGGETEVEERYVAPTIVKDVEWDDALMEDELFAPVMPIVVVKDVDEAIARVNSREHALALYIFSNDASYRKKVLDNTQSGTVVVNDVVIQYAAYDMPFGGVGGSGTGASTGRYGYEAFTHFRTTVVGKGWLDSIILKNRFPPYTDAKLKALGLMTSVRLPPKPKSLLAKGTKTNGWGTFLSRLGLSRLTTLLWYLLPVLAGYWVDHLPLIVQFYPGLQSFTDGHLDQFD